MGDALQRVDEREGGECDGREWARSIVGATVSEMVRTDTNSVSMHRLRGGEKSGKQAAWGCTSRAFIQCTKGYINTAVVHHGLLGGGHARM